MQCIESALHLIMRPHQLDSDINHFNFFRFTQLSFEDMTQQLAEIFYLHDESFKLNISFGFIMTNIETGKHQYFYPARNQTLLSQPCRISQYSDIITLIQKLKDMDILEHVHQQRPNTKWKLTHITNVSYISYNLRHLIGNDDLVLPHHIVQKQSITTLINNRGNNNIPYNENLCMFRALLFHKHKHYNIECEVTSAFNVWTNGTITKSEFAGVKLEDLPIFEKTSNINVNMYSLDEDDKASVVYKSSGLYEDTLYLNKYLNHVSYINNFRAYAKKFTCGKCGMYFDRAVNCNRHELTCDDSSKLKYPGGFYSSKKTVFELLTDLGIDVEEADRYHRHFAVYDYECMLVPENQATGNQTKILSKHHPISVSVCSTLSRKPECHISEKTEDLVTFMMAYFNRIQQRVGRLMTSRFAEAFSLLEEYMTITKVR